MSPYTISYNVNQGPNTLFGPTLGLNFGLNLGPIWRSSGSDFGPEQDCSTTTYHPQTNG
jgi:hypothetical protein